MLSVFEFEKLFPNERACFNYLFNKKWPNGFVCPHCQHSEAYKLKTRKLMQCKACKYQSSVTAGTIFHKMRLSLRKILWASYWIATTKKGISALELKRKLGLRSYQTAWTLGHKIRQAMKSSAQYPIPDDVEFDVTFLGLAEATDQKGRALVATVVQTDGTTIGRAYLEHLQTHSSEAVKQFMQKHVTPGVTVKTDGHVSYKCLAKSYQHHFHKMYDKRDNLTHLPKVHIVIANLKMWLRGTFNRLPNKHAQRYLDEFCFRFNRRWKLENIFEKLLTRAMVTPTVIYAELTG